MPETPNRPFAALVSREAIRLLRRPRPQRAGRLPIYFEDELGRRSAAKLLSKDEARRIAVNIVKLPDLLKR